MRTLRSPKQAVVCQRHTSQIITAAQKTEQGKETAKEVDDKLEEVFDHIEKAEEDIANGRIEQETAMEERQKDQRFARAKDALDLKEQGHDLDPTAGHEQGEQGESVQEKTRKNASPSKAVRQRLLDLEATRTRQPQQISRIINRQNPVPPMTHHYAAAAWWAMSALASSGSKVEGRLGYQ